MSYLIYLKPALYALIPTAIIYFLYLSVVVPLSRKKLLKQAEERGHVLIAKRVKSITKTGTTDDHYTANLRYGVYQYEYNGKTYKLKTNSHRQPPMEVNVYFRNNPAKAKLRDEFGALENLFWYLYAAMLILFLVLGIGR